MTTLLTLLLNLFQANRMVQCDIFVSGACPPAIRDRYQWMFIIGPVMYLLFLYLRLTRIRWYWIQSFLFAATLIYPLISFVVHRGGVFAVAGFLLTLVVFLVSLICSRRFMPIRDLAQDGHLG